MKNLFEDRMEENFNMAGYINVKKDMYMMNMKESDNFFESKYKVNFDDISSDEEEEDDTLPKYYLKYFFLHKIHSKVGIIANLTLATKNYPHNLCSGFLLLLHGSLSENQLLQRSRRFLSRRRRMTWKI